MPGSDSSDEFNDDVEFIPLIIFLFYFNALHFSQARDFWLNLSCGIYRSSSWTLTAFKLMVYLQAIQVKYDLTANRGRCRRYHKIEDQWLLYCCCMSRGLYRRKPSRFLDILMFTLPSPFMGLPERPFWRLEASVRSKLKRSRMPSTSVWYAKTWLKIIPLWLIQLAICVWIHHGNGVEPSAEESGSYLNGEQAIWCYIGRVSRRHYCHRTNHWLS